MWQTDRIRRFEKRRPGASALCGTGWHREQRRWARQLASSNTPSGIAVDGAGNVFVADMFNHTIRKITPSGAVTTFAGFAGFTGKSRTGRASTRASIFPTGWASTALGICMWRINRIPRFGKSPQERS
jgi:hypothetical protein